MFDEAKLQHHGVKGMKWGVRKEYEPVKTSELQVKKLLQRNSRVKRADDNYNKFVKKTYSPEEHLMQDSTNRIKNLTELNRFDPTSELISSTVKKVNEAYYSDIRGSDGRNFKNNCGSATFAYELRRRGYDCEAGLVESLSDEDIYDIWGVDKDDVLSIPPKTFEELKKDLEKMGIGARGFCFMEWWGGGGHICSFEVDKNGKVIFLDAQSGITSNDGFEKEEPTYDMYFPDETFKKPVPIRNEISKNPENYHESATLYSVIRTDNLPDPSIKIVDWIRKDDGI